jgi:hypothetical protein
LIGEGSRDLITIAAREEKDQEVQRRDHEESGKRTICAGCPSVDRPLGRILGLEILDDGNKVVRLGKSLEKKLIKCCIGAPMYGIQ